MEAASPGAKVNWVGNKGSRSNTGETGGAEVQGGSRQQLWLQPQSGVGARARAAACLLLNSKMLGGAPHLEMGMGKPSLGIK